MMFLLPQHPPLKIRPQLALSVSAIHGCQQFRVESYGKVTVSCRQGNRAVTTGRRLVMRELLVQHARRGTAFAHSTDRDQAPLAATPRATPIAPKYERRLDPTDRHSDRFEIECERLGDTTRAPRPPRLCRQELQDSLTSQCERHRVRDCRRWAEPPHLHGSSGVARTAQSISHLRRRCGACIQEAWEGLR